MTRGGSQHGLAQGGVVEAAAPVVAAPVIDPGVIDASLRIKARAAMGFEDRSEKQDISRFASIDAGSRIRVIYQPLFLGLLAGTALFQGFGMLLLTPRVAPSLGISRGSVTILISLSVLAAAQGMLQIAAFVGRRARRHRVAIGAGFIVVAGTLCTALATNYTWMLVFVSVQGIGASALVLHPPMLMDGYAGGTRVRVFAIYCSGAALGWAITAGVVGLTMAAGLTWRGAFLAMAAVAFLVVLGSFWIRDPGVGAADEQELRAVVRDSYHAPAASEARAATNLQVLDAVRRVMLIPTVRQLLVTSAAAGLLVIPLASSVSSYLDITWNVTPGHRATFYAVVAFGAIIALGCFGRATETTYRTDPARFAKSTAVVVLGGLAVMAIGIGIHIFVVTLILLGISFACYACVAPALIALLLGAVPSGMRAYAIALAAAAAGALGALGGPELVGTFTRRFGLGAGIVCLILPGLAVVASLRRVGAVLEEDIDRTVTDLIEDEVLGVLADRGAHLPLLACRRIDFSYGVVQTLFDVNFTVDEGEMVALLGTNGAGKSTLLRVISGLVFPTRGTVRLAGADITHIGAHRRVNLGLVEIEGSRATFRALTVTENLRLAGFSYGRNRAAIERGIDATFDTFPALASRRNQPASQLSGGEQQMLALGKALIVRPRLLLIDELSHGLAPIVVRDLLRLVRQINEEGTAVVLVEQSVSLALSLVHHAYFMEKGAVRFDGPAKDLVGREDLLRAVFLAGAVNAGEVPAQ